MASRYEAEQLRAFAQIIRQRPPRTRATSPCTGASIAAPRSPRRKSSTRSATRRPIDVRFEIADAHDLARRFGLATDDPATDAVAIWTTTPWTLPANQAVCRAPDLRLRARRVDASGRAGVPGRRRGPGEPFAKRIGASAHRVLGEGQGRGTRGPAARASVLRAQGAGDPRRARHARCRHRRRAHGARPRPGRLRRRPAIRPADRQPGRQRRPLLPGTPLFAGEHVFEANRRSSRCCASAALLHALETYHHSYPHCWRHKRR